MGSVVDDGTRVSIGRVAPVLLPWPIHCPSAYLVSTLVSVMIMSCRCVSLCMCLCVFGAFCLHGWVWCLCSGLLVMALVLG